MNDRCRSVRADALQPGDRVRVREGESREVLAVEPSKSGRTMHVTYRGGYDPAAPLQPRRERILKVLV